MRRRDQIGQASVELVAAVPVLILVALVAIQLAVVGYGLWSAATAARAGARAAYVGGDAARAARSALPTPLREGARIDESGPVAVRVAVPALLPAVPSIGLSASAGLGPGGSGG
jgi:hypothetical protein